MMRPMPKTAGQSSRWPWITHASAVISTIPTPDQIA